jgi:hypothetical protein
MSSNLPCLRQASNSFKHGLYSKKLTYSAPGDQQLYSEILHNYVQHYRPITPDEDTLVQQLAALQFRHLKVQTFQAEAMRAEIQRQDLDATPETAPETIETLAFEACFEKPAFRLYIQELNRLPNKIQRTIDRIHLLIRLRPDVANWPAIEMPTRPIPAGEQIAQPEETNSLPSPITTKESLITWWNERLTPTAQQILLYGEKNGEGRQAFFRMCRLPEDQFWLWLQEAANEGRIHLPEDIDRQPQAA